MPISQKPIKCNCKTCGIEIERIICEWEKPPEYCVVCIKKMQDESNYQENLQVIPPKFRNIEPDEPQRKLIVLHKDKSCFITGKVGRGKTVLMSGMVKELLRESKRIKWIIYSDFILGLQSSYRNEAIDPYDMISEIAKYQGILCVDDMGAEKLTDFVRQTTYHIINFREQYTLQTLITSNFSLAEIDEQIDSRVSSRIAGMCEIIELTGEDKRLNK